MVSSTGLVMDLRSSFLTPRAGLCAVVVCGSLASLSAMEWNRPDHGVDSPFETELVLPAATLEAGVSRPGLLSAVSRFGGGLVSTDGSADAPWQERPDKPFHELYFTRAIYPLYRPLDYRSARFADRRRCQNHRWCTDWPEADEHFSTVINRSLDVDVYIGENAMDLDDPKLRRFPFLYLVEPGYMTLTDSQREGLRGYLLQGGFLMMDDFWGTYEYRNFAYEMSLLFPEYPIVELPMDHALFSTVYEIDEIIRVPNYFIFDDAITYEQDGDTPWVHAIFDEHGRLLVVANAHTDIGDGMEHADDPYYPTEYSTYAFFMVMNTIVYAMAN